MHITLCKVQINYYAIIYVYRLANKCFTFNTRISRCNIISIDFFQLLDINRIVCASTFVTDVKKIIKDKERQIC